MTPDLIALIAEARGLANDHPCARGHAWETDGGRSCDACGGSQPVFKCARCGGYDYGERGGPGWKYCQGTECRNAREAWAVAQEGSKNGS